MFSSVTGVQYSVNLIIDSETVQTYTSIINQGIETVTTYTFNFKWVPNIAGSHTIFVQAAALGGDNLYVNSVCSTQWQILQTGVLNIGIPNVVSNLLYGPTTPGVQDTGFLNIEVIPTTTAIALVQGQTVQFCCQFTLLSQGAQNVALNLVVNSSVDQTINTSYGTNAITVRLLQSLVFNYTAYETGPFTFQITATAPTSLLVADQYTYQSYQINQIY
jgi:hypothetical protein